MPPDLYGGIQQDQRQRRQQNVSRRDAREQVAEKANFVTDLGASSLDLVELIMAIEDGFGIEISDSAAERIITVGDLLEFIRSQVPAARAA